MVAFQIPYPPTNYGKAVISRHELARLIEADRMLDHILTCCSYLEDGVGAHDCWTCSDQKRGHMTLREYLAIRVTGEHVPDTIQSDDPSDNLCGQCNGSGEGMYDGSRCSSCHGSGVEQEQEDRRDYDRDARCDEMWPRHYAGLLWPGQEP